MITAILLVYTIMHVLGTLFFKRDNSMLMCGIFAFSGRKNITPEELNRASIKMRILGIYNDSRGGQGAGVYINGNIVKCADKQKKFPNLIENNVFDISEEDTIMFGHCRKSSMGGISYDYTHPFEINENLIGVHNGTIKNIWSLTRPHDIDSTKIHNDSMALYMIIEKDGTGVLEEYTGGAALIWTTRKESNTLYVYHGASKEKEDGDLIEERPLFFMKTEEGIYFSSMEDSLFAIRNNDSEIPETLAHNRVMKVVNGKFSKTRQIIKREELNVVKVYKNTGSTYTGNNHAGMYDSDYYDDTYNPNTAAWGAGAAKARNLTSNEITNFKNIEAPKGGTKREPTYLLEKLPIGNEKINSVFFHRGRYYQRVLEGRAILCEGEIHIARGNVILGEPNPYTAASYFHRGVLLDSKQAFVDMNSEVAEGTTILRGDNINFAFAISKFSRYPVCNLPAEFSTLPDDIKYRWYKKQGPASECFTPQFGTRHYHLKYGFLEEITSVNNKEKKVDIFYNHYTEANNSLILPIATTQKQLPGGDPRVTEDIPSRDIVWDTVYESYEEFDMMLSSSHEVALLNYVTDYLKYSKERELEIDAYEINSFIVEHANAAIQKGMTIRQEFCGNDANLDLERYYNKRHKDLKDFDLKEERKGLIKKEDLKDGIAKMLQSIEDASTEEDEDTPKDEEEHEKNMHDLDYANDQTENAVDLLKELRQTADALQTNESEFAQNMSKLLYINIDNVTKQMSEITKQHSTTELVNKINQVTTF